MLDMYKHAVGMATHDFGGGSGLMRTGMVFTIEPEFRIPEEQIFIRLEDEPRRRVRIGVNQGIHTYVIVSEEQGKLATQTYSMIPADFNNLVISQIRECGVEISKNRFTRPSGI